MLLNPTGGVLGGDHLVTEIIQEAGRTFALTTPSATRVYRTSQQPAVLGNRDPAGRRSHAGISSRPCHSACGLRTSPVVALGNGTWQPRHRSGFDGFRPRGSRRALEFHGNGFSDGSSHSAASPSSSIERESILPRSARQTGSMEDFDYMVVHGFIRGGIRGLAGSCRPP